MVLCFLDAFKNAHDFLKGIDIVINAAGILDGANWEKEIATNVVSIAPPNCLYIPSFSLRSGQFAVHFWHTNTLVEKAKAMVVLLLTSQVSTV